MAKSIKNPYSISLPLRVDQGLRGYGDRVTVTVHFTPFARPLPSPSAWDRVAAGAVFCLTQSRAER